MRWPIRVVLELRSDSTHHGGDISDSKESLSWISKHLLKMLGDLG